jgi:hypothetical protein
VDATLNESLNRVRATSEQAARVWRLAPPLFLLYPLVLHTERCTVAKHAFPYVHDAALMWVRYSGQRERAGRVCMALSSSPSHIYTNQPHTGLLHTHAQCVCIYACVCEIAMHTHTDPQT